MKQYKTEDELIEELESNNGQMTQDEKRNILLSLRNLGPQAMEQLAGKISDFPQVAGMLLSQCGDMAKEILALNNSEAKETAETIRSTIRSLQKLLEKEDLCFEEKTYVIETIKCMTDQMLIHRREERREIRKILEGIGGIAGIVGIIAIVCKCFSHKDDD